LPKKKLQATDGKKFEIWIVDKFGGIPNEKGGKDLSYAVRYANSGKKMEETNWARYIRRFFDRYRKR